MIINEIEFKAILSSLRAQYDYDAARAEKLSNIYGSDVMPSDNTRLTNSLFRVLHLRFPPLRDGYCDIQTFCYDLNFGRSGVDIPLGADPIDILWDSLISKYSGHAIKKKK